MIRGWPRVRRAAGAAPSTTFDASTGVLPVGATFSRASGATRVDHRGYLEEVAADAPRYTYDPALTYNLVPNPWGDGAAAGSPGTPPAGWSWNSGSVSGFSIAQAVAVRSGVAGISGAINYTPTGTGPRELLTLGTGSTYAAVTGETVTFSAYTGFLAGSPDGNVRLSIQECNAAGANLAGAQTTVAIPTSLISDVRAQRVAVTRTLTNASCAFVRISWQYDIVSGVLLNFTLGAEFPVLNLGATPLTDAVPLATLAARRGTTPQYGLLGLLVERIPATNLYPNARQEGAVAGTPGTPPTNSAAGTTTGSGLTRTISLGVEDGIPWVGQRFAGTASAPVTVRVTTSPAPLIAAVTGETISHTVYADISGPTLPAATPALVLLGLNPSPTESATVALVAGPSFSARRIPLVYTLAAATTTTITTYVGVAVASGETVDFTIRTGYPQIEKSLYPSSLVLPPVAAPAASNRAADLLDFDPTLIDLDKSSLSMRFRSERGGVGVAVSGSERILTVPDGTGANYVQVETNSGESVVRALSRRASVSTLVQSSTAGSGVFQSFAAAWGAGSIDATFSGAVVSSAASSPIGPATAIQIGGNGSGFTPSNNTIRFLRIWKGKRLTQARVRQESRRFS